MLYKLLRFSYIYGPQRAFVKAVGRLRLKVPLGLILSPFKYPKKFVAIIGCGQFSFSTIAYFLTKQKGSCIGVALDTNFAAAKTLASCYGVPVALGSQEENFLNPDIRLVYVASNHASHTNYAVRAIQHGIDVYIEKPVCVSLSQFDILKQAIQSGKSKVYVGYNRPFSSAISELKKYIQSKEITLSCVVMGHLIPEDHWYRNPQEGTRVCGNLGHWIDLSLHLLNASGGVKHLDVTIGYSNIKTPDDNISVTMTSERGDLISLILTAREEPFEGINETIVFQQEELFVKIDDFRKAEFQIKSKKMVRRYWPKDVGHKKAILQPFKTETKRDINEVLLSTELMLFIMEMVVNSKRSGRFLLVK